MSKQAKLSDAAYPAFF